MDQGGYDFMVGTLVVPQPGGQVDVRAQYVVCHACGELLQANGSRYKPAIVRRTSGTPGLQGEFQVGDAEDSAPRLMGEAFDLPAVRKHDLLDDCQA